MHILIGLLTAIGGIVWALYRLQNSGVDLNSFNPFYWLRRRNWEKKMSVNPLYCLEDPMEVASLLIIAVAKKKGELARDTKIEILKMFQDEFGVSDGKANELYASSTYMLNNVIDISGEIGKILAPSKDSFKEHRVTSILSMLNNVSMLEGEPVKTQEEIMREVSAVFSKNIEKW